MKLYTEEQVISVFEKYGTMSAINARNILDLIKPIELPSDEEIEDKGKWVFNDAGHTIYTHYNTVPSWVAGAKWFKEQITKTK